MFTIFYVSDRTLLNIIKIFENLKKISGKIKFDPKILYKDQKRSEKIIR